ncbi:MAG: hypothetical protein PUI88_03565 [Prevotella sp.]|nr:hypothetical protein [Prevotella sp.]
MSVASRPPSTAKRKASNRQAALPPRSPSPCSPACSLFSLSLALFSLTLALLSCLRPARSPSLSLALPSLALLSCLHPARPRPAFSFVL